MNKQELISKMEEEIKKFVPVLKKNNNVENVRESIFSSSSDDSIVKVMTFSENELFNTPIKILLSEKNVFNNFSEITIQKKVVQLYHSILKDETKLNEELSGLVSSLVDASLSDFFVISEIENIRILDEDTYQIIDCTIKKLKTEDVAFKFESPLLTENHDLRGKPVIFTKVKSGDTEKAKEVALHNFLVSFNLLKLYATNFKPVLKGCLISGNQSLITYDETTKNLSVNLSKVGELLLNHAYIDKNLYKQLQDAGIEELNKDNQISKVVKECLYWFGLGLDEKYPAARLVNFVTVLESILKKKNQTTELKRTVSERGAILLYEKYEQRREAFKQLKKIYDLRSKVVHTGVLIDDENTASLAAEYARVVLIKLIAKSKEFNGIFDDFIESIDDIILGKTPT